MFWSDEWLAIQERREKFVSLSFVEGFVSYMGRQRRSTGSWASRMGTVRAALALHRHLDGGLRQGPQARLLPGGHRSLLGGERPLRHHLDQAPERARAAPQGSVGRKFPLGVHISEARRVLQSVLENYGARTRARSRATGRLEGHEATPSGSAARLWSCRARAPSPYPRGRRDPSPGDQAMGARLQVAEAALEAADRGGQGRGRPVHHPAGVRWDTANQDQPCTFIGETGHERGAGRAWARAIRPGDPAPPDLGGPL